MKAQEYVKNVLVTEARSFDPVIARLSDSVNLRLIHACAGISSEISELTELSDSYDAFDSDAVLDRVNLMEECGDILWYVGIAADALDAVDEIMADTPFSATKLKWDDDLVMEMDNTIRRLSFFAGELVDRAVKKHVFYGKTFDAEPLKQNLRSIHMNVHLLLGAAGYTVEDARQRNIDKLKARYGEKFSEAAALERNLEKEREILEKK